MMYELFGFDLADFKELFYVFCLAVLVYRYITVGRKHPLFRSTAKSEQSSENSVISSQALSRTRLEFVIGICPIRALMNTITT